VNDRLLWLSSITASTATYILYTELLGPGQIIHLIPAGLLTIALMVCLGMDPEAPRSFIRRLEERVSAKAEEAGLYIDPLKISYRVAYHLQILVLTCILYGLGVAATHLISGWSPGPLAALFAAPIALPPSVGIYVGVYDKARERVQKTSRELPFFATLASILSRAGLTLYTAFLRVSRAQDVMPQMAREAGGVKRGGGFGQAGAGGRQPAVVTLVPWGARSRFVDRSRTGSVRHLEVAGAAAAGEEVRERIPKERQVPLARARVVLGVGIELGTVEAVREVQELARRWGAAVGAEREAVEAGLAPAEWSLEAAGPLAPALYLGLGVRGSPAHNAAVQKSQLVVAVTAEPESALVQIADYIIRFPPRQVLRALLSL